MIFNDEMVGGRERVTTDGEHLKQAFFYVIFFHSHPFNEMFIVIGKSHCCNNTFTDVHVYRC